MKRILALFLLCLSFSLVACAGPNKEVFTKMDETAKQKQTEFASQGKPVEVNTGSFVGPSAVVPLTTTKIDPPYLTKRITFIEPNLSIETITQRLTGLLGVPVTLSPLPKKGGGVQQLITMSMNYTGDVRTFLDMVASKFNIQWEVDSDTGGVNFYKIKTKVYTVLANIGKNTSKSSISNKSNSGGGDTGSDATSDTSVLGEQSSSFDTTIDIWNETTKTVESMLSEYGSVAVNQSAGSITVSDVPVTLSRIEKYIKEVNRRLARQVGLIIRVYSLTRKEGSNFDFSLDAILRNAGIDGNLSGGVGLVPTAASAGKAILSVPEGSSRFNKHFNGSQLVMDALSTWGDTNLLREQSMISMHQQSTPIHVVSSKSFLKSSTNSQTASVGSTTTLEPGQVTTGFAILLTPNILSDNNLILQYGFSLSTLDKIEEIESNGSKIQLPEISSQALTQRVSLHMGDILVLSSYTASDDALNSGYGLVSYGRQASKGKQMIIITIEVNSMESATYEPFEGI